MTNSPTPIYDATCAAVGWLPDQRRPYVSTTPPVVDAASAPAPRQTRPPAKKAAARKTPAKRPAAKRPSPTTRATANARERTRKTAQAPRKRPGTGKADA